MSLSRPLSQPHDNQVDASDRTVLAYRRGIRFVLLQASVQSGKTGTYHTIAARMLDDGMIDYVIIVCGSNEIQLRTQYHLDVIEWHAPWRRGQFKVIFRQELNKNTLPAGRFLLIVDESHMVSKADQTVAAFLKRNQLTMEGATPHMVENHIYMLSVSATPYAELAHIRRNTTKPKEHVILENGDGYFGPQHYWETGRVRATWRLQTDDGCQRFTDLLTDYASERKYVLIRLHNNNRETMTMKQIIASYGFTTLYYDSNYEEMYKRPAFVLTRAESNGGQIPCLEDAPEELTIVYVDGRLRCGKRMCKDHVAWVWEGSASTKTDTAIQSLWGRMCGYDVRDPPLIFLPPKLLKRADPSKVVWSSEVERALGIIVDHDGETEGEILPRMAANLKPSTIQNRARNRSRGEVYPCVPIRMQIRRGTAEFVHLHDNAHNSAEVKALCFRMLMDRHDLIDRNQNLTDEQRLEIQTRLAAMESDDAHVRHYQGTSNQNQHRSHVEAYRTDTAAHEHISDFPFLTFCVTFNGYQPCEDTKATAGDVYVIFYTDAKGRWEHADLASRIACPTDNTYFGPMAIDAMPPCVAAAGFGFSPLILHDPAAFEQQFKAIIDGTRVMEANGGVPVGRRFYALRNGHSLLLPKETYTTESLLAMYQRIRVEKGVEITIGYASPRSAREQMREHHVYSWIEWA